MSMMTMKIFPKYLQWSFSSAKQDLARRRIIHLSGFFLFTSLPETEKIKQDRPSWCLQQLKWQRWQQWHWWQRQHWQQWAQWQRWRRWQRQRCSAPLCLGSLCSLCTTNATSATREQGAPNKQWAKHPQTEPRHDVCLQCAQVDQINCMSVSPVFPWCRFALGLNIKAGPIVEPS